MILVKQENLSTKEVEVREESFSREIQSDLPEAAHPKMDVISQLRANLSQVEDLHGRLRHVMTEVRTVIQKKA